MGLYLFKRLFFWTYFWGSLFSEGLIIGGNFAFQNGLDLTIKTASANRPWAYIREGLLSERYLRLRFVGLIFGRAHFISFHFISFIYLFDYLFIYLFIFILFYYFYILLFIYLFIYLFFFGGGGGLSEFYGIFTFSLNIPETSKYLRRISRYLWLYLYSLY